MYCKNCGKPIPEDSTHCPACGTAASPQRKGKSKTAVRSGKITDGKKVADTIYLCEDGKYRWAYEVPMLENPVILYTVWKVLGLSFGIVFLFCNLVDVFEGNAGQESLLFWLKLFGILAGAFLVLSVIAYIIVAAVYGWKYAAMFEMDDTMISHIQMPRQQKKADILGFITALAGIASRNPTIGAIGLANTGRSTFTTVFSGVKAIRPVPRHHVIKLTQGLSHNQIYAEGADYDFVLDYIMAHCPNAKTTR